MVDRRVAEEKKDAFYTAIAASALAPNPVTPQWLTMAEDAGMLSREALVDGTYYLGHCRNAKVARWDAEGAVFVYMRSKFGSRFAETINHPADDNGYDIFLPFVEVEPTNEEKISN